MPFTISSTDVETGEGELSPVGLCGSLPILRLRRFNSCSSFLALRNSIETSFLLLRASCNNQLS